MNDTPQEKGTTYIVLKWESESVVEAVTYTAVDEATATSANDAIRQVAQHTGPYVAIPARSWKPTKVTVETKQTVRLG
jgi:hypothetical protein